jgi:glyoxylase-like metal-dependent hydrolase (beta-lactamase superfamily II)
VIDTQSAAAAPALLQTIQRVAGTPIRIIVNTAFSPDRMGGNLIVGAAGQIIGSERTETVYSGAVNATIYAHEQLLERAVAAGGSAEGWPTDTYFVRQKDLYLNGEAVVLYAAPAASTAGDTIVHFRRADVIAAGDVYTPDRYPAIRVEQGGSVNGLLEAINLILRLAVPEYNEEGGTWIVPGYGRLSDESDVSEYRDMVTIVRDRVQDMVTRGMTLEQVLAAKPTQDYDPVYSRPAYTGAMFTEAVYRSLSGGGR